MEIVRRPFRLVREHLRVYLILNAVVYGTLLVGVTIGLLNPGLTTWLLGDFAASGATGLIESLVRTPFLLGLLITANNVFRAGLISIVLPSLAVPFLGIVVNVGQALMVGIMLAPIDRTSGLVLIPHSLTVVLEFQAYILLALGAFLLGRAWLWPATVDAPNRRTGYVRGLQRLGILAIPAVILLIIGGFYEAYSIRYLIPPLLGL